MEISELEYVDNLSQAFDDAIENNDGDALQILLTNEECNDHEFDCISATSRFYSLGKGYSELRRLKPKERDLREKELFYLRKAIDLLDDSVYKNTDVQKATKDLRVKLYTNYGGCLDEIGRKQSALEAYYKALSIYPTFGMALGNIGITFSHYSDTDPDYYHKYIFEHYAHQYLSQAVRNPCNDIYPDALEIFKIYLQKCNCNSNISIKFPNVFYKGNEQKYRKWALENRLFLNPLNDLPVNKMIFANDTMQLPNMVFKIDEKPVFHGLFNQIKQEYIYARYLYYKSIQVSDKPHFADKETHLLQFADYPIYSIRLENMKSAFRTLYSLLDKVAYFLNKYFDLGIDENIITFKVVWRTERLKNKDKFTNTLQPDKNYALTSLYWISRDFTDRFESSPNPYARYLSNIRNALEHKYLKVYDDSFIDRSDGSVDDWAFYVSEKALSKYTMHLMKLIREVILNLSFCVNIEEKRRVKEENNTKPIPSMSGLSYDDKWKL